MFTLADSRNVDVILGLCQASMPSLSLQLTLSNSNPSADGNYCCIPCVFLHQNWYLLLSCTTPAGPWGAPSAFPLANLGQDHQHSCASRYTCSAVMLRSLSTSTGLFQRGHTLVAGQHALLGLPRLARQRSQRAAPGAALRVDPHCMLLQEVISLTQLSTCLATGRSSTSTSSSDGGSPPAGSYLYRIAVPSYDRVETLQRNTLTALDSRGIDIATQVDLFVATEQVRQSARTCSRSGGRVSLMLPHPRRSSCKQPPGMPRHTVQPPEYAYCAVCRGLKEAEMHAHPGCAVAIGVGLRPNCSSPLANPTLPSL